MFCVMTFAQITWRESLRDNEACLRDKIVDAGHFYSINGRLSSVRQSAGSGLDSGPTT